MASIALRFTLLITLAICAISWTVPEAVLQLEDQVTDACGCISFVSIVTHQSDNILNGAGLIRQAVVLSAYRFLTIIALPFTFTAIFATSITSGAARTMKISVETGKLYAALATSTVSSIYCLVFPNIFFIIDGTVPDTIGVDLALLVVMVGSFGWILFVPLLLSAIVQRENQQ